MDISVNEILDRLLLRFPKPESELIYSDEFQLLIAVILSAQCTDKRVNTITRELFKIYNKPQDFSVLTPEELIPYIHSCGFFNNKAKSIIEASKDICEKFSGRVPDNMEDLMSLRGVGRKTANVMIAVAFNGQAIAVDTHVFRVSNRLGLVTETTPEKTEQALMRVIPKDRYSTAHHLILFQGRYVCQSRKPKCEQCCLTDLCKYYSENKKENIITK